MSQKRKARGKIEVASANYSRNLIESYDTERHVRLAEAYILVKSQPHLSSEKFDAAIKRGEIHVYDFKGERFIDRLDIGRIFHRELQKRKSLTIERYFSNGKNNPLDEEHYQKRHLKLIDREGRIVWELQDALFPESWDDVSAQIVAHKYFFAPEKKEWREKIAEKISSEQETSIKHLLTRVSNFFANEGEKLGYFESENDKEAFRDELLALQIKRRLAFNSPVQFNAGIFNEYGIEGSKGMHYWRNPDTNEVLRVENGEYVHPQCHACFIVGPRDDLESIAKHAVDEMAIFASGSGVGQDIGALRATIEKLSGGGNASGPLVYLKTFDTNAGSVKSGGKTRRAARMTTMRYSHPDIMKFVESKAAEDLKALTLMKAGYGSGMDGEAYTSVAFQNTNISVRLDDEFFFRVEKNEYIELRNVTDNKIVDKIPARHLLQKIAFGSWRVGDPGVQYESKIQEMHTCKNSGRQNSTNPCGEYMFLNHTACNLASLNLIEFADNRGNFDVKSYKKAIRMATIALDIANNASSYPVKEIAEISPEFRTIGLGYANLGALLMRKGVPYNSEEGRALASALTAILTGNTYETSAEMAKKLGTFVQFEFNKMPMMVVMKKHQMSLDNVLWEHVSQELREESYGSWKRAIQKGEKFGYRNAQATVIAPTGTISFLMGCDSTGIEPAISLIIGKDLAGGGRITLINKEVATALTNLGYVPTQIKDIEEFILREKTVQGAPHLNPDHYPVFRTSFGDKKGRESISLGAHIRMVAAAQPFVSGGISKTLNVPETATVKDIYDAFILGQKVGLKGATIFRNNSKPVSAMNFGEKSHIELKRGEKEDLPNRRNSYEVEVNINGTPIHYIVSEYPDGKPGQIAILSYTAGSTLGALLSTTGILASKALKRGVPLEEVVAGWLGQEFDPKGLVAGHPFIKQATSPLDFAAKLLLLEYLGDYSKADDSRELGISKLRGGNNGAIRIYQRGDIDPWKFDDVVKDAEFGGFIEKIADDYINNHSHSDNNNKNGKVCQLCGRLMLQISSNCYSCLNCGEKVGGCGA